jgi:flagella basal body P-ring formation protein FlgA
MNAMTLLRGHFQRRPSRGLSAPRRLAAVFLVWAGAARADQTLEVRRAVSASGPDILLKDLVLSPSELPKDWADRAVIRSPAPCQPQQYSLSSIAYALQRYPDMKDVTLRGDLNVTVRRDGVVINAALVEAAIRAYVTEQEACSNRSIEIELVRIPPDLRVPNGGVDIQVTESKILDATAGLSSFDLRITAHDSTTQSASVQGCIRRMREFWVARKPLEKGQIFSADDLEMKRLSEGAASRRYIPCGESIEGLELNRNLRAGQPIVREYLSQPLCASCGEQVNVVTEVKNLRVAMRAKALGNGRLGERILCLNEQSKRRLVVQLTGPREAALIHF